MPSLKQTIANRLNSLQSTGPRTGRGKEAASRNATTHGLSRLPATPPAGMATAIAGRMDDWRGDYRPVGKAQEWHFEQLVAESVRLDACRARIVAARAEAAERASESWDDDRTAEVASLAARLPDRPEVVQPRLLQSRHGVLWLIERWGDVAADLQRCDGWNPENWFLALDLLGVPVDGRKHSGPWDLDPDDKSAGPGLELARDGVEALRSRLEAYLDARDARHREAAALGLDPDPAPEVRRLERYAADARRQVDRNRLELRRLQAEAARCPSPPVPKFTPPGPRPGRSAERPRLGPAAEVRESGPPPSLPTGSRPHLARRSPRPRSPAASRRAPPRATVGPVAPRPPPPDAPELSRADPGSSPRSSGLPRARSAPNHARSRPDRPPRPSPPSGPVRRRSSAPVVVDHRPAPDERARDGPISSPRPPVDRPCGPRPDRVANRSHFPPGRPPDGLPDGPATQGPRRSPFRGDPA